MNEALVFKLLYVFAIPTPVQSGRFVSGDRCMYLLKWCRRLLSLLTTNGFLVFTCGRHQKLFSFRQKILRKISLYNTCRYLRFVCYMMPTNVMFFFLLLYFGVPADFFSFLAQSCLLSSDSSTYFKGVYYRRRHNNKGFKTVFILIALWTNLMAYARFLYVR